MAVGTLFLARSCLVSPPQTAHPTHLSALPLFFLCCVLQVQLVIDALKPGVVSLIRDLNGNHVVQRCLQVRVVLRCACCGSRCRCAVHAT